MKAWKILTIALLLLPSLASAQTHTFPAQDTNNTFTGTNTFNGNVSTKLIQYTVSTLPVSPLSGLIVVVTDGLSSSDCTAGGGSLRALCTYTGSAWVPLGGSGGTIDCSHYPGGDVGAKWNACLAAAPAGSTLTFGGFTSPQTMTTAVDVNKSVWNDMAGLQITQQAGITVSTSAVISAGEFDQAFNGDQITIASPGVGIQNNSIIGDAGTHTGNGINIQSGSYGGTLKQNAVMNHSANEILDNGGTGSQPTIVQNNIIIYPGDGVKASGAGTELTNNNFASSGGTGHAIEYSSSAGNFGVMATGNTVTHTSNSSAIYTSNGGSLSFMNGGVLVTTGYPAFDAPQGGILVITGNQSIVGGGANGPLINHGIAAGAPTVSNNFIVSNNLMSSSAGSDGIDFNGGQGDQVSQNQITLGVAAQGGKCGIKILSGISGMIGHNSVAITGGATATGDNWGICLTAVSGSHLDQNMVTENAVTGQGTGNTHDHGYLLDNTANVVSPFISGNTFQLNNCVDINICIDRKDTTINGTDVYINNLLVATNTLYNPANGSTADIIINNGGTTFATLPTAVGNGSVIYCSDCASVSSGGGTGLILFRINGAWTSSGTGFPQLAAGTNSNAGSFIATGNTWDFHGAAHTSPVVDGTTAGKPATCAVGEVYFATDATAGQNFFFCTALNTWVQQLNSGAAGMSTSGSNAAATAVGSSWIPGAVNTDALGSAPLPWTNLFLGTVANKAVSFGTGSITANRTKTWADNSGTVAELNFAQTWTATQTFGTVTSSTANAATAGFARLAVTDAIGWRNNANSGNISIVPDGNDLFTATTGYKSPIFSTSTATPAGAGIVRLASVDTVCWRNNANNADLCMSKDASDIFSIGGTPVTTSASINTFTNKTMNAESTGNSLSEPIKAYFGAAGCNNSTAGPAMDLGTTNVPTPSCSGSTVRKAVLQFARGNTAYINWHLPADWNASAATDIEIGFTTTDTTNGHITSFNIQTACNVVDGTATDDPTLNALQALSVTTGASQISGGELTGTKTGLTMTGCAADRNFEIAITRNNSGTDTNTDTAVAVKFAEVTTSVTKNAANR